MPKNTCNAPRCPRCTVHSGFPTSAATLRLGRAHTNTFLNTGVALVKIGGYSSLEKGRIVCEARWGSSRCLVQLQQPGSVCSLRRHRHRRFELLHPLTLQQLHQEQLLRKQDARLELEHMRKHPSLEIGASARICGENTAGRILSKVVLLLPRSLVDLGETTGLESGLRDVPTHNSLVYKLNAVDYAAPRDYVGVREDDDEDAVKTKRARAEEEDVPEKGTSE